MKKCGMIFIFIGFLIISFLEGSSLVLAEISNEDCLTCHSDKSLTKEIPGGSKSLYLDEAIFKKSVHKDMECVNCHSGIKETPHESSLPSPKCGDCHDDFAKKVSSALHSKIKGCWECHGKHDIRSSKEADSPTNKNNSQSLCLKCHKDREDKSFTAYQHSQVQFPGGAKGQVACYQCHDSHTPKTPEQNIVCKRCHPQILTEIGKSVHAKIKTIKTPTCFDCHTEHLPPKKETAEESLAKVQTEISGCGNCHTELTAHYWEGVHGKELKKGNLDMPSCVTCHGKHGILSSKDQDSPVFHNNVVALCVKCHEDEKLMEKYEGVPGPKVFKAYENSVHGKALSQQGLLVSPNCVDCHGSHGRKPADDPESPIHKRHIAGTCSKCHPGIEKVYIESVHGKTLAQGVMDSPTCTNCHGEHDIVAITDTLSRVSHKNIPKTCGACHAEEALASKYGLPRGSYQTYLDSFHGIANKYGDLVVADCASCHGYHDIKPSSDSTSSIHPKNIVHTCGKCHKGATENFAKGKVHIKATKESSVGVYIVRKFYTWFIGILVFIFVTYIILDVIGRAKRRKQAKRC